MLVETHNRFGNPSSIEATRVVVRDRYGNPLAVVLELTPGHYWMKHMNEEGFEQALAAMGLEHVVVDKLSAKDLPESPGQLLLPSSW